MRLGILVLSSLFCYKVLAIPGYYIDAAKQHRISATKLYAIALSNAGVTTRYGHYLPWPWSVTVDGRYYRFKSRIELFNYLKREMGTGKYITYGIAGITLKIQSPEKIWRSLDVNYNLSYASQRLKQFECSSLVQCVANYRDQVMPQIRMTHQVRTLRPKHQADDQLSLIIARVSREQSIDSALLHAIIARESAYKVFAKSHAGAMGLMQIMPATARYLGLSKGEYYDPYKNVTAGAQYIKEQLANFDGRLDLALAAYNAGPGNVRKYRGIPPFKETREYVPIVMGYYRYYKAKMG